MKHFDSFCLATLKRVITLRRPTFLLQGWNIDVGSEVRYSSRIVVSLRSRTRKLPLQKLGICFRLTFCIHHSFRCALILLSSEHLLRFSSLERIPPVFPHFPFPTITSRWSLTSTIYFLHLKKSDSRNFPRYSSLPTLVPPPSLEGLTVSGAIPPSSIHLPIPQSQ